MKKLTEIIRKQMQFMTSMPEKYTIINTIPCALQYNPCIIGIVVIRYFNINVWILEGNDISFSTAGF